MLPQFIKKKITRTMVYTWLATGWVFLVGYVWTLAPLQ